MNFKLLCSFCLLLTFMLGCQQNPKTLTSEDKQKILNVLDMQLVAWNMGDHEGFMEGYWKSDSLRFCGSKGTTYGWNTVLNNYKKSFPNRDDMRFLRFEIDSVNSLRYPQVIVDGQWIVERKDTIGGYFTLLFDRPNGKNWKIIEDHTW